MLDQTVLLRADRRAVRQAEHLQDDLTHRSPGLARLAAFDQEGVLRKTAGVKKQRQSVPVADGAHRAQILQTDRLATATVVGDRHHDQRDPLAPHLGDQPFQRRDIHVPLERMKTGGVGCFGNRQVHGVRAGVLDIGPGRVEMRVVGYDLARPANQFEQDALARPALVGRQDVLETGQFPDPLLEPVETDGPGIGFVSAHDAGPLLR